MPQFTLEAEPDFIGDRSNWASLVVRYPPDPAETARIVRNIWKVLDGREPRVVFSHLFLARVRSKSEFQWLRDQLDLLVDHHQGGWQFVFSFHHKHGVMAKSDNLDAEVPGGEIEFLAAILGIVPGADADAPRVTDG